MLVPLVLSNVIFGFISLLPRQIRVVLLDVGPKDTCPLLLLTAPDDMFCF
jgi:hypothetical protein